MAGSPEAVIERLGAEPVVFGEFEQVQRFDDLDYPLRSSGRFVFWRERGLYLAQSEPFDSATTLTPDGLIQWDSDERGQWDEGHSGLVQREIGRTLLAFLGADIDAIEERFAADWCFSEDTWTLTLTPQQRRVREHIERARLSGQRYLRSLELTAANGDTTRLSFTGLQAGDALSDSQCRHFGLEDGEAHCPDPDRR